MAIAYKKIAFLAPHPALTPEEFKYHWRHVHGPLVAGSPGYINYRLKYVQNHVLARGPIGAAFGHPGIAEFWLPGDGSNEAAFSGTATYRNRIKPDEEKFIDMTGTIAMSAIERVIVPGNGPSKLMVISARANTLDSQSFVDDYDLYAEALLDDPGFSARVVGWSVNHVVPGSFTLPGAYPAGGLMVDCVEEFWFRNDADINLTFAAIAKDEGLSRQADALFDTRSRSSFVADELVFFDHVPLTPSLS